MSETVKFELVPDNKGVIWDLLLYIPTVVALASIAASFWYGDDKNMGYVFFFLTCFFFIVGVNRIFKTRLMLFPTSAISLAITEQGVTVNQKDGVLLNLISKIRFYSDYSAKSFGLSGVDGTGKQLQFVFLKGQFLSLDKFDEAQKILKEKFK